MLIGIDVGGTKNALVLCDDTGRVLKQKVFEGTNASEIGWERACDALRLQASDLLSGHEGETVTALYAGLAGGAAPAVMDAINDRLKSLFPEVKYIGNGSDALNGLYACIGVRSGMVAIAGTGSAVFVRSGGALHQVGGWGYLIDDAGSGYALGRAALNAAFRDDDGRGEDTALTDLCRDKLGCGLAEGIPALYGGGKRYIADFAPLALQAADMGDEVALDIVGQTCDELALLIRTGAQRLDASPYRVALSGSLWKSERIQRGVTLRLGDEYELLMPALPPVFGAALAAADMAGLHTGERFKRAFSESYIRA